MQSHTAECSHEMVRITGLAQHGEAERRKGSERGSTGIIQGLTDDTTNPQRGYIGKSHSQFRDAHR